MDGKSPEDLKYAKLCSAHFEDSQYMNPKDRYVMKGYNYDVTCTR